jgi:hypothetical protein
MTLTIRAYRVSFRLQSVSSYPRNQCIHTCAPFARAQRTTLTCPPFRAFAYVHPSHGHPFSLAH